MNELKNNANDNFKETRYLSSIAWMK